MPRIPESFTLRDWSGGRSCVRSRKSPWGSSSVCDASAWYPPSFTPLHPCIVSLCISPLPWSRLPLNTACVESGVERFAQRVHWLRYGSRGANVLTATGSESFICKTVAARAPKRERERESRAGLRLRGACERIEEANFAQRSRPYNRK